MADNYTLGVTVKATTAELQSAFQKAISSLDKLKSAMSDMLDSTKGIQQAAEHFADIGDEAIKASTNITETESSVTDLTKAGGSIDGISGSFEDISESSAKAGADVTDVKSAIDSIGSTASIDELSSDFDLASISASDASQSVSQLGIYVDSIGVNSAIDELKTDFDLAGVAAQQAGVDVDSLKASTDSIGTGTGIDNLRSDFDLAGAAAAQAAASIDEGYVSLQRITRGTSLDPVQGEFVQLGSAADEAKVSIDGVDVSLSDLATSGAGLGVVENQFADIANEAQKATSQVSEVGDKAKAVGSAQAPVKGLAGAFFKSTLAAQGVSKAVQLVGDHIGGAVRRVDTLNNASSVFQNMGFSATEASDVIDNKLSSAIDGLPTRLDEAVSSTQMLAASTGDLSKSAELYGAINDAVLGFGGSAADAQNAVLQLSQGFANGKLQGQEWMSMMNSQMGPVLNAMADDMGITTEALKEGLSSGAISVEEFQDSLIKLDQQGGGSLKSLNQIAKDNTKGIGTSLSNVGAHIEKGIGQVIDAMNDFVQSNFGQSIGEMISSITPYIDSMFDTIASTIPQIGAFFQKVYDVLSPFVPLLIPIAAAFGAIALKAMGLYLVGQAMTFIKTTITLVQGAVAALNAVIAANPVTLIIGAIVGVVAVLIWAYTQVDWFRQMVNQAVDWIVEKWQTLVTWFQMIWEGVIGIFDFAKSMISTAIDYMKQKLDGYIQAGQVLKEAMSKIWTAITDWISQKAKQIGSAIDNMKQFFSNLAAKGQSLLNSLRQSWEAIKGAISTKIENIKGKIRELVDKFMSLGDIDLFDIGVSIMNSLWEGLKNIWDSITGWLSGLGDKIKELKGPIQKDRKLLIPEGQAIMKSLGIGMNEAFKDVQHSVGQMADQIAKNVRGTIGVSSSATITQRTTTRLEPPRMNILPTKIDMNANRSTSTGIAGVNNKLDNAIDLMTQILNKDDNVYLDRELLSTRIGDDIRRRTEITTKYQNRRKGVLA